MNTQHLRPLRKECTRSIVCLDMAGGHIGSSSGPHPVKRNAGLSMHDRCSMSCSIWTGWVGITGLDLADPCLEATGDMNSQDA